MNFTKWLRAPFLRKPIFTPTFKHKIEELSKPTLNWNFEKHKDQYQVPKFHTEIQKSEPKLFLYLIIDYN